ncbi:MAG: hypothetical protein AMXMBFR36_36380 [Acidobacteriota bacterium]
MLAMIAIPPAATNHFAARSTSSRRVAVRLVVTSARVVDGLDGAMGSVAIQGSGSGLRGYCGPGHEDPATREGRRAATRFAGQSSLASSSATIAAETGR